MKLSHGAVDIWEIATDLHSELYHEYSRMLNEEESERARRFVNAEDRITYVIAHAALRLILARYLAVSPMSLAFVKDDFGKPSLRSPLLDLQFNLSHSGGKAVVGVSIGTRVGIDIEHVKPCDEFEQIVRQYFTIHEMRRLDAVARDERLEAFYRIWTRKEAFVKGVGLGLSHALDGFDVSLGPDAAVQVLGTEGLCPSQPLWYLHEFSPWPDYLACLAVPKRDVHVRRIKFDGSCMPRFD